MADGGLERTVAGTPQGGVNPARVQLPVQDVQESHIGHGFRNFDNYRLRLLLHCGTDWHNHQPLRTRSRRPRLVA
jgi:hypothetical protein